MWQPSLNELDHKIVFGMFLAKGSMVKHTLIKIGECLCFMKQPIVSANKYHNAGKHDRRLLYPLYSFFLHNFHLDSIFFV